MNRIFVDMDGVIVDFDKHSKSMNMTGDEIKKHPGAYLAMEPIEGALAGVRTLIGMGWEVWIATKPPTGIAFAYADKAQWIMNHLPELRRKIIITHDKGLLGDSFDFLIDDRPHKANCEKFAGKLIAFGPAAMIEMFGDNKPINVDWPWVLNYFRKTSKWKQKEAP